MPFSAYVPTYKLYGDTDNWPVPEYLHCESIPERSVVHDWTIRPHRHHDLFQMIYCRRGMTKLVLDGKKRDISGPYLVMVPILHVHGFAFDPTTEGWVVTLPVFALKRFLDPSSTALKRFDEPHVLAIESAEERGDVDAMFQRLAEEFLAIEPGRPIALEASLSLILVWALRKILSQQQDRNSSTDKGAARLRQFHELIEKNYRNWRPIHSYAADLGVTPAQLNNTCRALAGKSALQIVHDRVLIEAKRHLVYTEMGISEVAYSLGFSDPAYFARFFKKRVGSSPSQFQVARRVRLEQRRGRS